MLRKIACGLLFASALFTADTTIASTHVLVPQITISYDFKPGKPEVLENFTTWTINAECQVSFQDDAEPLHVKVIKGSGEVNGVSVNENGEIDIIVHNMEKLALKAPSLTSVEFLNNGDHVIHASCRTK